jgi:hypothetical protein
MTINRHAVMPLAWLVASKPTQSRSLTTLQWTGLDKSAFASCYFSGQWTRMKIDKLQRHWNEESGFSTGVMNVIKWAADSQAHIRCRVNYSIIHSRAGGSSVGWCKMLQAEKSRVPFPMRSLDFSTDLIFPGALWPLVLQISNCISHLRMARRGRNM